jgi:3-oxoacyl-[acyl-carrier-protein] synthase-3
VIGAESLSKILDFNDRTTSVLFGDGAGAIIMRRSSTKKMLHYTRSEGDLQGVLTSDGLALNPEMQINQYSSHFLRMQGQAVFRFAVKAIEDVITKVLQQTNLHVDQIDWIVPHQANRRIIEYVANKMNIDLAKFYLNLDQYGNTSSASIPIALSEMKTKGLLKEGMRVICVGFGAGLTWGGSYFES